MDAETAADYHSRQIGVFADAGVDLVSGFTITYAAEGAGIVNAANAAGVPSVISFTVETDGRLPSGDTLADAIARTDDRTAGYAVHYMINCAHPTHFEDALVAGEAWTERIRGMRGREIPLEESE